MGKGKIGSDLNFLATLLNREKLCSDTSPLYKAANELRARNDEAGVWGYNLQRLTFKNIEVPRGTEPSKVGQLTALLNVEIHERECDEHEISNPIIVSNSNGVERKYIFSIEVFGLIETEDDIDKIRSCWHLDFDSKDENEYIHPDFHLTFGGEVMSNMKLGQVLLLPSPRLPYPPMDAILGVDFIIRNFIKKEKSFRILNDPQYKNAVKTSQERLWRPYMLATANHWCKFLGCSRETTNGLSQQYNPFLQG